MAKDFSRLRKDDNGMVIPTSLSFVTQDATASPQKSPLAITTSVTTIAVPTNAAEIVMRSSVAFRFSEEATIADRYWSQPALSPISLGVAEMDVLYVKAESASGTLNFYFNCV